MNVCIIPARGTSKRLPRKNVLPINGKPMLVHPIETALASNMFECVIVSTEDEEIAKVAEAAGAKVFPRPMGLQAHQSGVVDICRNVLTVLSDVRKLNPEQFCCIYPTAIFLTPDDLRESFELLQQTDFVMGVTEFVFEPAHAMVEDEGYLKPINYKMLKRRSPSLPKHYSSNGTLYWARVNAFMNMKTFYGPRLIGYHLPLRRAFDINTPDDLEIAKTLTVVTS